MTDCTHHWRLEEPKGNVVAGVCLLCVAERTWTHPIYNEYSLVHKKDPLPRRTNIGATSLGRS